MDECTIQLDHHGSLCFRKEKEPGAKAQNTQVKYISGVESLLGVEHELSCCSKYIGHLHKVMLKVIEVKGSGYRL